MENEIVDKHTLASTSTVIKVIAQYPSVEAHIRYIRDPFREGGKNDRFDYIEYIVATIYNNIMYSEKYVIGPHRLVVKHSSSDKVISRSNQYSGEVLDRLTKELDKKIGKLKGYVEVL
jgi:hypothetical protein